MKKTLLHSTLLAAAAVTAVSSTAAGAHAESLHVRIPFAFTASGNKLPAGDYTISEMTGNPAVLLIAGSSPGSRAMVFARTAAPPASASHPVIFANEGSSGMVMLSVMTATGAYELSALPPRTTLAKDTALAIGGTAPAK